MSMGLYHTLRERVVFSIPQLPERYLKSPGMRIQSINIKNDDGEILRVSICTARRGFGLGDVPAEKPEREISLTGEEVLREIADLDGLCTKRFRADLVTEGLDYASLVPGTRLRAGEAVLEISSVGKRCFSECALEKKPCALGRGCVFAAVITEGVIAEGDEVTVV